MRAILAIVVVLVAVVMLWSFRAHTSAPRNAEAASRAAQTVVKREADSGGNVALRVGDQLNIELAGNAGTGFQWAVAGSLPAGLTFVTETTAQNDNAGSNRVGGPERSIFQFKAVRAGAGTVTLHYRRPWEKDQGPAKTFKLGVTIE